MGGRVTGKEGGETVFRLRNIKYNSKNSDKKKENAIPVFQHIFQYVGTF